MPIKKMLQDNLLACYIFRIGITADRKHEDLRKSMILVLILLGWELFISLLWLFIGYLLMPLLRHGRDLYGYDRSVIISNITVWFVSIVSIVLGIVFLILAKHKGAKALLIAYIAVQAILFFIYRIPNIF